MELLKDITYSDDSLEHAKSLANNLRDSIELAMEPIRNQFLAEMEKLNPIHYDLVRCELFSCKFEPSFEPKIKKYRIAKDVFNSLPFDRSNEDIGWDRRRVIRDLKAYFVKIEAEKEQIETEKKREIKENYNARRAEMLSKVSKKPVFIPDDCFKIVKDYMGVFDIPEIISKRMMKITMVDMSHHDCDDIRGFRISKQKSLSPTERKQRFWSYIITYLAKEKGYFSECATPHTINQAEKVIKDSKVSLSEWNKNRLFELLLCPTKCQKEKDMFGQVCVDYMGHICWQYYSLASCVYEKF
jgi:hypothetical protein